jgi:hypothetical protein
MHIDQPNKNLNHYVKVCNNLKNERNFLRDRDDLWLKKLLDKM